jgi:hypothetical protein
MFSLARSAFICAVGRFLLLVWRQLNDQFRLDWFPCFPIVHGVEQFHLSIVVFSNLSFNVYFFTLSKTNQIINDVW